MLGADRAPARSWPSFGLAVVAGLAGALAFPLVIPGCGATPSLDLAPREAAIFVSAAILFRLCTATQSLRRRALFGLLAGVVHFGVLLYWLDIAMADYGHMPQWQALPALLLLVASCAAFWAALPLVVDLLRRVPALGRPLAFALAVVFLEWLRGTLASGFPWGLWGYSQARNAPLLQLASLGGVYAVSFVIALVGAWGARALSWRGTREGRRAASRCVGLLVTSHLVGAVLLWAHTDDAGPGLRVALLQGNVAQEVKNQDEKFQDAILERYLQLSREATARGVDLIIWPEAAWPGRVLARSTRLEEFAPSVATLIGVSAYDWVDRRLRATNSAFWIEAGGNVTARYDKQHLVPFGEYVPLGRFLPVDKFVTGMVDFSAGDSARPTGPPGVGVLICYDGIFPEITRAEVEAGARLLANLTNDAWYGVSSAPYQHRDFYVFRAVESDRFVARVANSGVSAFVSPTGTVSEATALDGEAIAIARVYPRETRTLYVRLGDWLPAVAIGAVLGALLLVIARRLRVAVDKSSRAAQNRPR